MIRLRNLHKSYTVGRNKLHVLKGIDLDIGARELVAVMGASGSGKSTLMNILGLLDRYDEGEYTLDGVAMGDLSETRAAQYRSQYIGFVFQSFHLIPFKNAAENVALPLYYQGVPRKERNERAAAYLEKVGLADRAEHLPSELSGGQQQRVAIARALCMDPICMLFDEPTSALDPEMINEVLEVMVELAQEGMTMMCVTHEMGFARKVANRVIFMDQGRVVEDDTAEAFFATPRSERAQQFLAKILSH